LKKVIILGGGMVGSAMAVDLSEEFDVTVADNDPVKLEYLESTYQLKTIITDLSADLNIKEVVSDYHLVICAVPGYMGFETLRSIISAGKDVVDISFFDRDPFDLDELANTMNVTAVVDCGVSPGLSNIILGYHNEWMNIESYTCYVGGLPFVRKWPFEYKAFFSPIDVIQEYIRPARFIRDGKLITKEALSDPELIDFDRIGKLEAFNTDGLRSLLKTMKIPNMIEKTLRYPGHIELMRIFREAGFFSEDKIEVNDISVSPVDVTTKLLFEHWKPEIDEDEFTILKFIISGTEENKKKEYIYEMFDRFDPESKTSSMARTTGYTATSVARLILDGTLEKRGILPPEYIGAIPGYKDKIVNMLAKKNIKIRVTENIV